MHVKHNALYARVLPTILLTEATVDTLYAASRTHSKHRLLNVIHRGVNRVEIVNPDSYLFY